jgi:hypothetical protein
MHPLGQLFLADPNNQKVEVINGDYKTSAHHVF